MDRSILEGNHPTRRNLQSAIVFGRITQVFPETRTCEVKTFGASGASNDQHIPGCQWINMDAHPDGDESTNIPRAGSYGLIFFVDSEPFLFGFFSPLTGTGSAALDTPGSEKEPLNEGDRVLKTVGKNRIIMRAHGEIQIESTATCRTIYFPDKDLINTICRNYEFRTDGGSIDWTTLDRQNNTLFSQEFRDNIARTNIIVEERGYVNGGEFISRSTIGPTDSAGNIKSVYNRTVAPDGTTRVAITAPGATKGFLCSVAPAGDLAVDIAGNALISVAADGTTTVAVKGIATWVLTPGGKFIVTTTTGIDLTTDGEAKITAKGGIKATTDGDFTVEAKGKGKFKADNIELDGGGSLEKILTTPSAVSDFTGAPIQKGSGTVKASS